MFFFEATFTSLRHHLVDDTPTHRWMMVKKFPWGKSLKEKWMITGIQVLDYN